MEYLHIKSTVGPSYNPLYFVLLYPLNIKMYNYLHTKGETQAHYIVTSASPSVLYPFRTFYIILK